MPVHLILANFKTLRDWSITSSASIEENSDCVGMYWEETPQDNFMYMQKVEEALAHRHIVIVHFLGREDYLFTFRIQGTATGRSKRAHMEGFHNVGKMQLWNVIRVAVESFLGNHMKCFYKHACPNWSISEKKCCSRFSKGSLCNRK